MGGAAAGQNADGSPHGLGIGVIAVVQNGDAVGTLVDIHAHLGGDEAAQTTCDLLRSKAKALGHSHGHGDGIDHVLAQSGDLHCLVHSGGSDMACDIAQAVAAGDMGGVVQPLSPAAEHSAGLGLALQGGQEVIVAVEDQQTVGLNVGQHLALGFEDILPAAQTLNVGIADVGDDTYVGLDGSGQIVDLAKAVHAHLQHAHGVLIGQTQDGQGHAQIVVEVALGFQDVILLSQHAGDHVLGSGLAHAAGDRHEGNGKQRFIPDSQILQRHFGVFHLDIELVSAVTLQFPVGEDAGGAVFQGGVNIGMAVEALPHNGQKQSAFMDGTAVHVHHVDGSIQIVIGSQQSAAHGGHQLAQGDGLHYSPAFLASREFSATFSHRVP